MTPENSARRNIDSMLEAAGWHIQDYAERDTGAALGIAVREYPLAHAQRADYLLFVSGLAVGFIEAKKAGTPLSGAAQQAARYRANVPAGLPTQQGCPFVWTSTGIETYFQDAREPHARTRLVFAFHTPETLQDILQSVPLRQRLKDNLPFLEKGDLRNCQFDALSTLEASLKAAHPRALVQMATGSGKTYLAVSSVYRLIKFANTKRVLFLVDRNNLGRQTLREFQAYTTPDDGRKFTELYNVQHLSSNTIDAASSVCITTIQRLYSMLKGEPVYESDDDEEGSAFELEAEGTTPQKVAYNPNIPIDTFDLIIVDECHRSIYGKWRHVLEYFDAFVIGLTATPYPQTRNFFNQNLVYEYRHAQAVADKVNVGYYVYKIETEITQSGSHIEAGHYVARRDRETRHLQWNELDTDVEYTENQLDRDFVAEDQIRTVIQTFKDKLFTDLFPGRRTVPKTLIFAKDDSHAEDIVRTVRAVFAKGDEFCQKITYQSDRPEDLIRRFRTQLNPRIAVSVDMISTGTDIKPLECLLFMRAVRSSGYFEQMIGRGVRTINPEDLRAVTGDADAKTHFIIVDAVGVCESIKTDSQSLPGEPSESNGTSARDRDQLMDNISEDRVVGAGFDNQSFTQAGTVIHAFKQFIDQNTNELLALRILCKHPEEQGRLTEETLKELEKSLKAPPDVLTYESIWFAYQRRSPNSVRGNVEQRTDLISLVRYAIGENAFLEPFKQTVNRRFVEWLHGKSITGEQRMWLEMVRDHIATSLDIQMSDFEYTPFAEHGNGAKVYELFGDALDDMLKELTEKLVS